MKNCLEEQRVKATIIGMEWERVTVHMEVQLELVDEQLEKDSLIYYAVNGLYKAKAMFKVDYLDDNRVKLSMNITNPGDCQCLRMGTYSILVCDNGRILAKCMVDPAIVPFMEDYSRSFLHNNRTKAFVVSFSVAKDEDELPLVMYSMDEIGRAHV